MQQADLELKSSAITLSDMEMFIFPELIYALTLANIMSPAIWRWKEDPWFKDMHKLKPYRRILRLKQYIMDHYNFNLDLDTWGLTTKEQEMNRFKDFIDADILKQSNALFGYEGDKYYFDIDIRTHFGLDKYEGNVIPYWKTETVEAMDAFHFKPDYPVGAGECVSLATLYAAALFIVAEIELKDIYLMATPLHSQNFVDIEGGILTNNRRLVTKNMWFNGTALSAQARRALENERVTIVAHESGVIQTIYDDATIDENEFKRFTTQLSKFLSIPVSPDILVNFLRQDNEMQKCFQIRYEEAGAPRYIKAERLFAYEHGSPFRINLDTRAKLLHEVEMEEFRKEPIEGRLILNDFENHVKSNRVDLSNPAHQQLIKEQFTCGCIGGAEAIERLGKFAHTEPRFPDRKTKNFENDQEPLGLKPGMSRDEVIKRLESIKDRNRMAQLSFYAYRDLNRTEAEPFLKASTQRNPVCIEASKELSFEELAAKVEAMPNESIYEESGRLSQPDEVWNYGRGDGAEKAILLANVARSRGMGEISIAVNADKAVLTVNGDEFAFESGKGLREQSWNI